MRKIEFRAKAINRNPNREYRTKYKNGDWVYGLLSQKKFTYGNFTIPAQMTNTDGVSGIDVEMDTIGQYTGLKDKNGKKIYEGDIVIFNNQVFEVVFEHGSFGLECHQLIEYDNIKSDIGLRRYNGCYSDNFISLWEIYWNFEDIKEVSELIEVIDNIYDNHEVLEVNDDTK